jgi:hypothetical protein
VAHAKGGGMLFDRVGARTSTDGREVDSLCGTDWAVDSRGRDTTGCDEADDEVGPALC